MTGTPPTWQRRALLAAGALALAGWVLILPRLMSGLPSGLGFRDLPDLPPFRELATPGSVSAPNTAFAGIEKAQAPDPDQMRRIAEVRAAPCAALFGQMTDQRLPVAFFTDFNCPNCRVLDAILTDYDRANPGMIRIIRHELPLLGDASVTAARAVLAADRQGASAALQKRLMRAPAVTDPAYVAALAASVGIDQSRLLADMQSPKIDAVLNQSKAIASVFGFYAVPGTVIGRTVVLGAIPEGDVAQIIRLERAALPLTCKPA